LAGFRRARRRRFEPCQGMQTVLAQGDARPERVLRRFFIGLTQIWRSCHSLNQAFLPKNKQFLICGYKDPSEGSVRHDRGPDKIQGSFMFDFSANALNTSQGSAADAAAADARDLRQPSSRSSSGSSSRTGSTGCMRDGANRWGRIRTSTSPPTPNAMQPPIFVEDAIA
jgi:hypothetical protein